MYLFYVVFKNPKTQKVNIKHLCKSIVKKDSNDDNKKTMESIDIFMDEVK